VLAGEWMPITFLKNDKGIFKNVTSTSGINNQVGWWNTLAPGDFDNDGDIDYIAGNLGLNTNYTASTAEPLVVLAKDLDKNGSLDAMVFCYMKAEDGTMKPFPMATKQDMATQLIAIRKKYPTYKSYGYATMDDLWNASERSGALMLYATYMSTSYIENKGNGNFTISALPLEAQAAPVFGMLAEDADSDGNLDVLMVGNDYGMDPYTGKNDALNGFYLKGNGKGSFQPVALNTSGFYVPGDAKALSKIHGANKEDLFIATQNQDSLKVYAKSGDNKTGKWITLQPEDFFADIIYKNGSKKRVEFYYGNTYLSQSSRKLEIPTNVNKIIVTNYKGIQREIINK